jgi:large subunit ribosomal protein L33
MSQDNLAKMECTVCKRVTHYTLRNKKKLKNRLELNKLCNFCTKHTPHKETK